MSKAASKRARPKTAVTVGWVVKKRFTKNAPDRKNEGRVVSKSFDKTISRRFSSKSAAETFLASTLKYPPPHDADELNIDYYVSEDGGFDDLPACL